ncbi:MAG: hypothetical protein COA50_14675 [Flavobacteriaceae bacterium]|nr:MAG: hypothetical protein COA50_14675 [Flavobacteriaceae bacterium]
MATEVPPNFKTFIINGLKGIDVKWKNNRTNNIAVYPNGVIVLMAKVLKPPLFNEEKRVFMSNLLEFMLFTKNQMYYIW